VPLDVAVPQAGILLFFYFDGHLDDGRAIVYPEEPETLAGARVLYLRPGQAAAPRECPAGLTPYGRVELAAEPVVTFPGFEHPDLQAAFNPSGEDLRSFLDHPVNGEAFTQALSRRRAGPCHQVGWYATPVQGPVESDAAVAALGGGEPRDDVLLAEQARWRLLAQIDSDDRIGMMWGDAGTPVLAVPERGDDGQPPAGNHIYLAVLLTLPGRATPARTRFTAPAQPRSGRASTGHPRQGMAAHPGSQLPAGRTRPPGPPVDGS